MADTPTPTQRQARGTADRATGRPPSTAPPRAPAGTTVTLAAGGFPGVAGGDAAEIDRIQNIAWVPSTRDFRASAALTSAARRYEPVNSAEFFGALANAPKPIRRIVFFGHGFRDSVHLGERDHQAIDSDALTRYQATIDRDIKPRLASGATLDVVACNVAMSPAFSQQLADSLGVIVRAFPSGVCWCVSWRGPSGPISSRGLIAVPTENQTRCRDAQGRCTGTIHRGADKLSPPVVFKPRTRAGGR